MLRSPVLLALCVVVSATLAGCGGGGSARTNNGLDLAVDWPAWTRNLQATDSAQSVLVVLNSPDGLGKGYSAFTNRGSDKTAHTTHVNSLGRVPAGYWRLSAEYHTEPEGAGPVVATANAIVQVRGDGAVVSPSGAPLGGISAQTRVAGLQVFDGQRIDVGASLAPQVGVWSMDNQLIAVAPGAIHYSITDGASHAAVQDGLVKGLSLGDVTVSATVDGVQGAPAVISIVAPGSNTQTVAVNATALAANPGSNVVYAAVPSSDSKYPSSVVAIDTTAGHVQSRLHISGGAKTLGLSKDGSKLYAISEDGASVAEIDLPGLTLARKIDLGMDQNGNPVAGNKIAVSPANPKQFAVSTMWFGAGVRVFQDGVRLAHVDSMHDFDGGPVTYNETGTSVYTVIAGSPSPIVRDDLDASGVVSVTRGNDSLGAAGNLDFAGGKLFDGAVKIDPVTLQTLGRIPDPDQFSVAFRLDPSGSVVWQLGRVRLTAFDAGTLEPLGSFPISVSQFGPFFGSELARYGDKGIAIVSPADSGAVGAPNSVILLNHAPGL